MIRPALSKVPTRRLPSVAVKAFSTNAPPSYPVIPKTDFGQYSEYSVIHTDRSLNLMSNPFGSVMRNLNDLMKYTYQAEKVAIIPGSGTFGMEAVARQFANGNHAMVLRNGWFSYRWTEIFDMGGGGHIAPTHTVCKAVPQPSTDGSDHTHFRPMPIEQVVDAIHKERPSVFFCPHVETSTGMMLPDDYIKSISNAMHSVGGLVVLDCIASGTVWVDMKQTGVDVLISAPQKGWTGAPCSALIMMSERAVDVMNSQQPNSETSFSLSLKRWSAIMDAYEKGGFAYHTTMPTDALRDFHEVTVETLNIGLPQLKDAQLKLGWKARAILDSKGLTSVAAPGYQAPGVLVYYSPADTANPDMMKAFHEQGMQIAMGVPWKIDEPVGLKTFRIGLFGLDKLTNIDHTTEIMEQGLDHVLEKTGHKLPAHAA